MAFKAGNSEHKKRKTISNGMRAKISADIAGAYEQALEFLNDRTIPFKEKETIFMYLMNKVVPNAKPEESPSQSIPLSINVSFDDSK